MPSFAIRRADLGHGNIGDIMVILLKNYTSPVDRKNKIYSADYVTGNLEETMSMQYDKIRI